MPGILKRITQNLGLFVLLLLLGGMTFAAADKDCRFAANYQLQDLIHNEAVRNRFYAQLVKYEAKFMRTVGLDQTTKMTLDGQPLDVKTGVPLAAETHMFSAPSKECLHLGILAQALERHPVAFLAYDNNMTKVLELLREKAKSYEKFDAKYPGYGGFLPWFALDGKGGMAPTWDWQNKLPSLDNGEMLWAAFAVAEALKENHPAETELIASFENVWRKMVKNAIPIFFAETGSTIGLRTVVKMTNQSLPVDQNTYTAENSGGPDFLDDPYEGELFVVALDLFSDLLTSEQKEAMWVSKRKLLQKVDLVLDSSSSVAQHSRRHGGLGVEKKTDKSSSIAATDSTTTRITVERGFWFSAHEKWKYLFLPYHKAKNNWRVFVNGERARTHYASFVHARGMWASVNGPITENGQNGGYFSDCGIQQIAFNPVTHDDLITPYGAFPLFLVREYQQKTKNNHEETPPKKRTTNQERNHKHSRDIGSHRLSGGDAVNAEGIAAAWLHHMIVSRQGQNCFGTTEGFNITGVATAPLVTWDTKITSLLAIVGGNVEIVGRGLDRLGATERFVNVVNREWGRVFGDVVDNTTFAPPLAGEALPFLPPNPTDRVPELLNDFDSCSVGGPACSYNMYA